MPLRRHALTETAAEYGVDATRTSHTKLSISLPNELAEQVRSAAAETGLSVSGIVAAAIRRSMAATEQERLDRALALDAEDNAQWANDALTMTARAWAELEW